ncbi:multidrug effflux MFS transporter [Albibacterium bauzanense]|uniref:DHA1 family bicyclomycin/chloramphenicol resistance-like MFS transporter n=1 Tax=Albibacterium bauzanense TaxID=653929 RepID=A0A4R1LY99_9SPHI|nr:multidrug effflux MFS transporter [Albibacterium bauzanense]TCK83534.1 DHA1 family bicyclomycin/chloramphenicol resistance-like MFS transporter [Albibacterium bauzanense]
MTQTKNNKFLIILMLGLLSAIGPFSIDMYLPGFKAIALDLQTNIEHIQLSLTSFFIGIAGGQMIYGPLLDRFGRKSPLLIGLLIYIGASIGCVFIQSADGLIFLRFVQALGSCAGMVASRAMVRDYFPPTETAKIFSMLMLVIGISPILAPTIGGYIIEIWGWHYIFVFLTVLTILILLGVIFVLPKSKPNTTISLLPAPIMKGFWKVLKNPQFLIYAIAGGTASSGLYAYLSGSPFVMMEIYGLNEKQYGWVFALLAAGLITTSQLNTLMLKRFSSESISKYALMAQAIAGSLMLILALSNSLTLYGIIILIFCFLACQGFVFPNTSALALNPFSKSAGSASALLGTIQLSIGAIASVLVSIAHNRTNIPMVSIMAACAIVSYLILLFIPKNKTINTASLDLN